VAIAGNQNRCCSLCRPVEDPEEEEAMSKVLSAAATIAAFGFLAVLMTAPKHQLVDPTETVSIMEGK
jgi:hypothetical protein